MQHGDRKLEKCNEFRETVEVESDGEERHGRREKLKSLACPSNHKYSKKKEIKRCNGQTEPDHTLLMSSNFGG